MLDNHPPEGTILPSQAAWIPPLDLSSSRSRGMPPQAFGTTASLRSVCPGSAYYLVLVLVRLRSEIRTLPSFSPLVEARRASNSALDRGVAWGEDVGKAALAVCRGSFRRKWTITIGDVFMGVSFRNTDTTKRCSNRPPPFPALLVLGETK